MFPFAFPRLAPTAPLFNERCFYLEASHIEPLLLLVDLPSMPILQRVAHGSSAPPAIGGFYHRHSTFFHRLEKKTRLWTKVGLGMVDTETSTKTVPTQEKACKKKCKVILQKIWWQMKYQYNLHNFIQLVSTSSCWNKGSTLTQLCKLTQVWTFMCSHPVDWWADSLAWEDVCNWMGR